MAPHFRRADGPNFETRSPLLLDRRCGANWRGSTAHPLEFANYCHNRPVATVYLDRNWTEAIVPNVKSKLLNVDVEIGVAVGSSMNIEFVS